MNAPVSSADTQIQQSHQGNYNESLWQAEHGWQSNNSLFGKSFPLNSLNKQNMEDNQTAVS